MMTSAQGSGRRFRGGRGIFIEAEIPVRKFVWIAMLLVGGLVLHGCGGGGGGTTPQGPGPVTVSFAADIQPIFNTYCVVCHTPGGASEFLRLTNGFSYGNLVNVASTMTVGGGDRVEPSNSAVSVLWKRVSGIGLDASDAQMPEGGFPLPAAEQALIQDWIDQGALNN